ncbi:type II secretion system F family protein [Clostridium aestuarii]|uniref:Type II secretion system F family protein n=1 Tax=Clostridium aestuarii TaxID=338193 RepID=A0ABT4CXL1_9CLOT|nr:type II secretion system F family protein [Clostridium aestuarii]MCY6483737.1 type II secretion system F family protein [Clostridium aestuarii]
MKVYKYEAVDIKGNNIKGKYLLDNEKQLINILGNKEFFLLNYTICHNNIKNFLRSKVSYRDLAIFSKCFFEVLNSGINLSKGLEIMLQQKMNISINESLSIIKNDIEEGKSIFESMKEFTHIYPKLMIEMVEIGEQSGSLDKVFLNLHKYYLKQYGIYRKIRGILIYPKVLIITTIVITVGIITKIVPVFVHNFMIDSIQVPSSINRIIAINNFFRSKAFIILLILLVLVITIIKVKGYSEKILDNLKYKLPYIKDIYKKSYELKFARNLNLLIGNGIPIITSINIVKNSLSDNYMKQKTERVILNIEEGMSLADALKSVKFFDEFYISMIEMGEETGKLDDMLDNIANIYEENINDNINTISSLIEPITIIILSIIIAIIIINIMMPIINVINSLGEVF